MNWLPLGVSKLTVVFSVSPSSERSLTVLVSAVLQGLTGKVRKNTSNILFSAIMTSLRKVSVNDER